MDDRVPSYHPMTNILLWKFLEMQISCRRPHRPVIERSEELELANDLRQAEHLVSQSLSYKTRPQFPTLVFSDTRAQGLPVPDPRGFAPQSWIQGLAMTI